MIWKDLDPQGSRMFTPTSTNDREMIAQNGNGLIRRTVIDLEWYPDGDPELAPFCFLARPAHFFFSFFRRSTTDYGS